ncbi:BA75_01477T0 [Komagataella pastoris]|uniref:BA75_01477T0 n=1 Tax=Komagataella pastoris TaxID=4922 RepID=A0A1B2J8K0_PICPA|nr:BA75_01477T0 [Komagataella pastoris]
MIIQQMNKAFIGIFRAIVYFWRLLFSPFLQKSPQSARIADARDIKDIVQFYGYQCKEYVVTTRDGYLLTVHRIYKDKIHDAPVVYLQHGLLTNSELFVLNDSPDKIIPFQLVDNGYDVWLGNNRGNKYSRNHTSISTKSERFWNFSLNEYAIYDIPDSIRTILHITNKHKILAYIGFSQGTAQGLASLSLNPYLNDKIQVMIGLSPAFIPPNLRHPVASFAVNAYHYLPLILGHRAIMPSVHFWKWIMGQEYYQRVVDLSLIYLFNWQGDNISSEQKQIGYPHLFSNSSVKSILHWFQIIKNQRFEMFDEKDHDSSPLNVIFGLKGHLPTPFPTNNISTKLLLIYGTNDTLMNIPTMLPYLPHENVLDIVPVQDYEHMDLLWGKNVDKLVIPTILKTLDEQLPFAEQAETVEKRFAKLLAPYMKQPALEIEGTQKYATIQIS